MCACVLKVWQVDESGAFYRRGEAVEPELQPGN